MNNQTSFHKNNEGIFYEGVQKDLFNREAHKEGAKHAKINNYNTGLCILGEKTLRSLRLIYSDFLDTLQRIYDNKGYVTTKHIQE